MYTLHRHSSCLHAASEQIRRDQNALLEILKLLIARQTLRLKRWKLESALSESNRNYLLHGAVYGDTREVLLDQQVVERRAACDTFDEDDNLER